MEQILQQTLPQLLDAGVFALASALATGVIAVLRWLADKAKTDRAKNVITVVERLAQDAVYEAEHDKGGSQAKRSAAVNIVQDALSRRGLWASSSVIGGAIEAAVAGMGEGIGKITPTKSADEKPVQTKTAVAEPVAAPAVTKAAVAEPVSAPATKAENPLKLHWGGVKDES